MIVELDLSLTPQQKTVLTESLVNVHTYLTSTKIKKVIRYWSELSDEQRARVVEAAPLFGKLVAFAELFQLRLDR